MVCLPVRAHRSTIAKDLRLTPVVLPIMCVYTHLSIVVVISVWTPDCFEMVKVEVHIYFVVFDQLYRQFFSTVSEAAVFPVLAFLFIQT
jgi:hypothetical protein